MDKQSAIKHAGGVRALARLFGINPSAVSRWGDKLPPLRVYQLKEKRPHWFRRKRSA